MGYEEEFLAHLEKLIRSLDRRIIHGRERLRKSAEAKHRVNDAVLATVMTVVWYSLSSLP